MNWTDEQGELDRRLRESILAEPVDSTALDNRVRQKIARGRRKWMIAGAGIAAMVVIGAVSVSGRRVADPVCAAAAQDHRREVVNREHRAWREDFSGIQQLAEREGVPVLVPDGYRFERGKLCRLDGKIFLHLVFTDGAQEFSVYLRHQDEEKTPRDVDKVQLRREHVASFQTARVMGVVVADQSSDAALQLARVWREL